MLRRSFFEKIFGTAVALELPEIKTAEILRLKTSDTIVVTLPGHPSSSDVSHISALFEKNFPGQRVLIKGEDVDICVIRSE